jgi:hypothetical protein
MVIDGVAPTVRIRRRPAARGDQRGISDPTHRADRHIGKRHRKRHRKRPRENSVTAGKSFRHGGISNFHMLYESPARQITPTP